MGKEKWWRSVDDQQSSEHVYMQFLNVCVYYCVNEQYVCMCVCACVLYVYLCVCVWMCVFMCVHICVCMCMYMHALSVIIWIDTESLYCTATWHLYRLQFVLCTDPGPVYLSITLTWACRCWKCNTDQKSVLRCVPAVDDLHGRVERRRLVLQNERRGMKRRGEKRRGENRGEEMKRGKKRGERRKERVLCISPSLLLYLLCLIISVSPFQSLSLSLSFLLFSMSV